MPPMPAKRSNESLTCHAPRDEIADCSLLTSDRFRAGGASLGEQLAEAVGAVRLVVARRESLASQGIVAVTAGEAVSVPRLVLVRHPAASDDLRRIRSLIATRSTSTAFEIIGIGDTLLHLTHRVANLSS